MRNAHATEVGHLPEGDASLGSVFSELNRKKWWIFLPTLLAFVGAVIFVNVVKPKYTGQAQVLLENRDNYFTRPDKEQRGTDPPLDSEAVQSQVQTIMSRDIARSVIKKLDLASREEFDPVQKDPSALKRILSIIGLTKDPLASSPEERIFENYFDKLLVFNVGKSRVISVEFSSREPELAQKGANLIAEEYISFQRDAKKATTQGASAWLAQAIEPMRARVAEAEAKVEAFRAENGLLIGSSNATIATQQLGEMNTQMSAARSMQSELNAKARMIREALKNGRIFETSEVVNNELVRRLLEQRVAMKTQMALEERTLLPGHPRMKELSAQLNDLESQIRTAAERTARTLENDARVAGARVQSLQAEFDNHKKTAANANEHEVQLRALEREARALRDNYEQYLAKYRDALSRDADAAAPADARIISRAVMPQLPAFPKKVPIILLATLATLVLSSAIIITRHIFSTDAADVGELPMDYAAPAYAAPAYAPEPPVRARPAPRAEPPQQAPPPSQVRAPAEPPPQSVMPPRRAPEFKAQPAPQRPPQPAVDEALGPLAQDLAGLKSANAGLIVDCRSFGGDVASTATALPLSRMLAGLGRTILVDLGGGHQDIEQATGRFHAVGVSDSLAGLASFGDVIHRDVASRMHIIPFGTRGDIAINPASEDVRDLLDALAQTYDFVVLDLGDAAGPLDTVARLAGAIILVASRDDTDPAVQRAFQRLDALRPGRVTIVVEEPAIPTPHPANDRYRQANSAA